MEYRLHTYFKPNTLYLFDNGFRLILAEVEIFKSSYWFTLPGMHIKATTAKCVELSELRGIIVTHIHYKTIQGKIAGHTGIQNTPYLYIYWERLPNDSKTPIPCALPDINYFDFLN